jgi:hypothetical protein
MRRGLVLGVALSAALIASSAAHALDTTGTGEDYCFDYWFDGDHFTFTGGALKPDGAGGFNGTYGFTAWVWPGKPVACSWVSAADHSTATITGTWDETTKTAHETIVYSKPKDWGMGAGPISRSETTVKCARDPWQDSTYQECTLVPPAVNTLPAAQHFYPVSAFRISKGYKATIDSMTAPSSGDTFKLPPAQGGPGPIAAGGAVASTAAPRLQGAALEVAPEVCVEYQPGPVPALRAGGSAATVPMALVNCGRLGWNTGKPKALAGLLLEYHWIVSGAPLAPDNVGTDFGAVAGGATTPAFKAKIKPPAKPGTYALRWELRFPDGTWISEHGGTPSKPQTPIAVR